MAILTPEEILETKQITEILQLLGSIEEVIEKPAPWSDRFLVVENKNLRIDITLVVRFYDDNKRISFEEFISLIKDPILRRELLFNLDLFIK